jgi:oxalate decarboxylase/phosphoglucose isomerase-like protein (cupin superfamily)
MDRADADTSEAFLVLLQPGQSPPLHVHYDTEQVFYVIRGRGELQVGSEPNLRIKVQAGNLIRIPPGTHHRVICGNDEPLEYLSIDCFLKGRPSHEPTWESHLRAVCVDNGWNFDNVRQDSAQDR